MELPEPKAKFLRNIHINDQQFCFSLQALCFQVVAASPGKADKWLDQNLGTFDGNMTVS
jgi:hypothetical protein